MVLNVVEGTYGLQGTVSGTDQTVVSLTNADEHTSPNVLRIWVENQAAAVVGVSELNTLTGSIAISGTGGIGIDTVGQAITLSAEVTNTLTGVDGITVISGTPTENETTISGFRTEFVNASGTLSDEIDTKVAKAGDTMTGDLWLDGADLTISGTTSGIDFLMGDVAVSGMITVGENHNYPTGVGRFILIPSTAVQKGQGGAINIQAGFWNKSVTQIDSAQLHSQSSTFIDQSLIQETGPITSAHTLFQKTGFHASTKYRLAHDGTSTGAVPLLAGFASSPSVKRESGYTGNATITQMCGFVTNPLNPLLAFLSGQQVNAGFTINKYAHFEANSNVTGGLVNTGGTVLEEVGLDLQNINVGDTCISIRSTATGAPMQHAGGATIGENRPPQAGLGLDVEGSAAVKGNLTVSGTSGNAFFKGDVSIGVTTAGSLSLGGSSYNFKIFVENNDQYFFDWCSVKYSNSDVNHHIMARALGTKASPSTIASNTVVYSLQGFGYANGTFCKLTSFNSAADDTLGYQDIPGSFQFKVHKPGTGVGTVTTALEIHSNLATSTHGRWAYDAAGVVSASLNSDVNNYAASTERGLWRLTANTTNRTITGITAPSGATAAAAYPEITIINVGATYNITLANQNASSTDVNRIITGTGADLTLTPDQVVTLIYDNTTDRWRVISRNF